MIRSLRCGTVSVLLLAAIGRAEVITLHVQTTPNPPGWRVTDIYVDTDGAGWFSGAFYCELDSGVFLQDPSMSQTDALNWTCLPGINGVDSWVAPGISYFADADEFAPVISGDPSSAVASITFVADPIDDVVPAWNGLAARFVYSTDAAGGWVLRVGIKGSDPIIFTGYVNEGYLLLDPVTIPGDLNEDNLVGDGDLDVIRANWGQSGFIAGVRGSGDASFDSVISGDDLDVVRANWGNTLACAVPEPCCWIVVTGLGLIWMGRHRGKNL